VVPLLVFLRLLLFTAMVGGAASYYFKYQSELRLVSRGSAGISAWVRCARPNRMP
jgi:hypothetical protein